MKLINYFATLLFCVFQTFLLAQNVIHVPGDYPNIQTGILFASNGDTVLVAPGLYKGVGNKEIELLGVELFNTHVQILDIRGKLVRTEQVFGRKLDISDLNNGIYFICLIADNQSFRAKIIKK